MRKKYFLKIAVFFSLVLFIFSVTIAILLAELLIKYVNPQITEKIAKQVSLRAFRRSEFLPYELTPNKTTRHIGHTYEFDYVLNTNSLGLRDDELKEQKGEKEYRLLMLGDSMTFGWGVEDNESFPSIAEFLIAEKIKSKKGQIDVNIINAGMASGFAPDTYYLYLKEKGLKLDPDLVVVNIFVRNDIYDLFETSWDEIDELGYPTRITSLYSEFDNGYFRAIDKDWKMQIPIVRNSHLGLLLLTVMDTKAPQVTSFIKSQISEIPEENKKKSDQEIEACLYQGKCTKEYKEKFEELRFIIKGIKRLTEENKISLLVFLIPDPYQLSSVKERITQNDPLAFVYPGYNALQSAISELDETQPQLSLRKMLDEEEVKYFDALGYLITADSDEMYFRGDGHYRKEGNEKLANAFLFFLTTELNNFEIE